MSEAYNIYMPSADDFIMLILGISESLYDGRWAPTAARYGRFKPDRWPVGTALLRALDYKPDAVGWREFMQVMVELPVITGGEAVRITCERRAQAEQKTSYKIQDHGFGLAVHYQWPWCGARERKNSG